MCSQDAGPQTHASPGASAQHSGEGVSGHRQRG